jgi:hypothetical protein
MPLNSHFWRKTSSKAAGDGRAAPGGRRRRGLPRSPAPSRWRAGLPSDRPKAAHGAWRSRHAPARARPQRHGGSAVSRAARMAGGDQGPAHGGPSAPVNRARSTARRGADPGASTTGPRRSHPPAPARAGGGGGLAVRGSSGIPGRMAQDAPCRHGDPERPGRVSPGPVDGARGSHGSVHGVGSALGRAAASSENQRKS